MSDSCGQMSPAVTNKETKDYRGDIRGPKLLKVSNSNLRIYFVIPVSRLKQRVTIDLVSSSSLSNPYGQMVVVTNQVCGLKLPREPYQSARFL